MTVFKTLFAFLVLVSTPSFAILDKDFLFPQTTETRPTLVLDVDDVLCRGVDLKNGQLPEVVQKNLALKGGEITPILYIFGNESSSIFSGSASQGHLFFPYTGEHMLLLWSWGWDIATFSSAIADRNERVIPQFVKITLAKYFKDPEAIWNRLVGAKRMRILSRDDMKDDKKDLTALGGDIRNKVLVEDRKRMVVPEQYPYIGLDFYSSERFGHLMTGQWDPGNWKITDPAARNAAYLTGLLHRTHKHMIRENTQLREAVGALLKNIHNDLPTIPQENKGGPELTQEGEQLIEELVQMRLTPPTPHPLAQKIVAALPTPAHPHLRINLWERARMTHLLQSKLPAARGDSLPAARGDFLLEAVRVFSHPQMQGEDYLGLLEVLLDMTPRRMIRLRHTFEARRDAFYFPGVGEGTGGNSYFLEFFQTLAPLSPHKIRTIARRHHIFFPQNMDLLRRIRVIEALSGKSSKDIRIFSRILEDVMPLICSSNADALFDMSKIICALAPLSEAQIRMIAQQRQRLLKGIEVSDIYKIIKALASRTPEQIMDSAHALEEDAVRSLLDNVNAGRKVDVICALAPRSPFQMRAIASLKDDLFTPNIQWEHESIIQNMGDFTPQRFYLFKNCMKPLLRDYNDGERIMITKAFFELSDDQMKVVSENFDQLFPKMNRHNSTHGHFLENIKVLSAPHIKAFANAARTFLEKVQNFELDSWAAMPRILKELTPDEIDQLRTTLETPGPLRDKMIEHNSNYQRCEFIEKQVEKITAARGVKAE